MPEKGSIGTSNYFSNGQVSGIEQKVSESGQGPSIKAQEQSLRRDLPYGSFLAERRGTAKARLLKSEIGIKK